MVTWVAWFVAIGMAAGGFVLGIVAASLAAASARGDRMHAEAVRHEARRQQVLELVARLQGPLPPEGVVRCVEPGCRWEAGYVDPHEATLMVKTHRYATHGVPWGT